MLRIIVTGGSGFLGRELLAALGGASRSELNNHLVQELGQIQEVVALSRSEKADTSIISAFGTSNSKLRIVRGDMNTPEAFERAFSDGRPYSQAVVFHMAAKVDLSGSLADHRRIGLEGTQNLVAAAKLWISETEQERACKLVYVSSEQAILGGATISNADETWPYPNSPLGPYATVKGEVERFLKENVEEGFHPVTVRPRMIWGAGDTVVLPGMVEMVRQGKFKFIGGGEDRTSTCEVRNVVEGLLCAAKNGIEGELYFVTDQEDTKDAPTYREFFGKTLATRGIDAATLGSLPQWLATLVSYVGILDRPLPRLVGEECTVVDVKARRELGYTSHISMKQGYDDLEKSAASA